MPLGKDVGESLRYVLEGLQHLLEDIVASDCGN